MTLSGSGDHAGGSDLRLPAGESPRTVEAWVRFVDSSREMYAVSWGTLGQNQACMLGVDRGRAVITQIGDSIHGPMLSTGQWHHLAAVYDGTYHLYVDGELAGEKAMATMTTVGPGPRIGNSVYGQDKPFAGDLDEVRIWSRALSASEVAGQRRMVFSQPPAELVAAYDFEVMGSGAGIVIPNRGSLGAGVNLLTRSGPSGSGPSFGPGGAF